MTSPKNIRKIIISKPNNLLRKSIFYKKKYFLAILATVNLVLFIS